MVAPPPSTILPLLLMLFLQAPPTLVSNTKHCLGSTLWQAIASCNLMLKKKCASCVAMNSPRGASGSKSVPPVAEPGPSSAKPGPSVAKPRQSGAPICDKNSTRNAVRASVRFLSNSCRKSGRPTALVWRQAAQIWSPRPLVAPVFLGKGVPTRVPNGYSFRMSVGQPEAATWDSNVQHK